MKSIQFNVTLDATAIQSLTEVIQQAIERANRRKEIVPTYEPRPVERSAAPHNALSGREKPPEVAELLVNTKQVTKLLNVSPRKVFELQVTGGMPAPIKLGRSVRWSYEELKAWIAAGGPPRDKWVWPKPSA